MPPSFPGLFGGMTRSRLLFALVLDGPETRRGLARRLDIDPTFALQRLRSLERAGLLLGRDRARQTWEFDWSHPVADEIARVVARYAGCEPPREGRVPRGLLPFGHLETFGSPGRTLLLLALAQSDGATLSELSSITALSAEALRSAAFSLARVGVVSVEVARRRRTVRLESGQPALAEVRALLDALNVARAHLA